jgi:pullulanase
VTVKVHYVRSDSDYAGWNAYLWRNTLTNDKEVSAGGFNFQGTCTGCTNGLDSYGAFVSVPVDATKDYDNIGVIIRSQPSWEGAEREPGGDRFIEISDGIGEIWLVQGETAVYTSQPSLVPRLKSARIDDFRKITVSVSSQIDLSGTGDEGFSLDGGLTVTSVKHLSGSASRASLLELTVDRDLTLGTTYTLSLGSTGLHGGFDAVQTTVGKIMNSAAFQALYTYTGDDLGSTYTVDQTRFVVWAPTASLVELATYPGASSPKVDGSSTAMSKGESGTWTVTLPGDQIGLVYTYVVHVGGAVNEAVDPYARAVTTNGVRGVVVDLTQTDPAGWLSEVKPAFSGNPTDAIIYEMHIRDLSMDSSSGILPAHKGKYLALTDNNSTFGSRTTTVNPKTKKKTTVVTQLKTGVNAIKDLGVTHVQLQPIFDFASGGNETNPIFNWGYDPLNYNAPEGSYSTEPSNPTNRIIELKQGVQSLHSNGLRVMMDVVYNHVASAGNFSEELIVPGYFFRTTAAGALTNGSGCGNDVASERPMVRKFIVDSVKYWASQYHLDGFRFDLMGLIDIRTMNEVRAALTAIDPTILVIGEGWNMGTLPDDQKAGQLNLDQLQGISVFNDQLRDGIKGSVFNSGERGYATGVPGSAEDVRSGVIGNVFYTKAPTSSKFTTVDPAQSVNYVEAHDNLTLWDKLKASAGGRPEKLKSLDRFAVSMVFLSQGVPFMQAGQEFLRSKLGNSNSYRATDSINSIKWSTRVVSPTLSYYKGLIQLRMGHPVFRLATGAAVNQRLNFLTSRANTRADVLAFSLDGSGGLDSWATTVVGLNPNAKAFTLKLPSKGVWQVVVSGDKAGSRTIKTLRSANSVVIPAQSTVVLHR